MGFAWTDYPVSTSTHIRTIHINELRDAVDTLRSEVSLAPYTWTDNPVSTTTHIRAIHFNELRSALDDVWTAKGMGPMPNWSVGTAPNTGRQISARDTNDLRAWVDAVDPATLVGATWVNNSRPWGQYWGWDVDVVYLNPSSGFDITATGARVQAAVAAHRNVLVRVDYAAPTAPGAPSQSLPPEDNDAARADYIGFLQTLCGTPAYAGIRGYIIGNEYNKSSENSGGTPITPDWYARVFNGYGVDPGDTGNACDTIRTYQPGVSVLVGAVGPWMSDGNSPGTPWSPAPAYWLNYFNGVCQHVFAGAAAKSIPVDGMALHTYGRPGTYGASEPHTSQQNFADGWYGAQQGFQTYKDWLAIVSQQSTSVQLWITETNTDTTAPSSTSYPTGWYLQALAEIKGAGSQFQAVCWFVDIDQGGGWSGDSLNDGIGQCAQASTDFNTGIGT